MFALIDKKRLLTICVVIVIEMNTYMYMNLSSCFIGGHLTIKAEIAVCVG